MGKGSIAKITAALAIIAAYTFMFGVMGKIEGMENAISAETEEAVDAQTDIAPAVPVVTSAVDENGHAIYTYVTELNVANGKKPSLADYTHTQPMMIIPSENETEAETTTAPDDYVANSGDFDYTTPAKTSAPAATQAPVTTAVSETTLPATFGAPTVTTVSAIPEITTTTLSPVTEEEEDDAQPPDVEDIEDEEDDEPVSDAASEIFTVNADGQKLSGSALDIVSRAVMAEIGDGFADEAIKAQAIATYTYIKYYNDNNQNAYIVNREPSEKLKKLVGEVLGKALYYNGSLIQAVYCASTAGYTASAKTVWGVDYPYLRSKETPFDVEYDINYGRKPTFTPDEMKDYVRSATGIELSGDPSEWFTIEDYVDNVYVGKMTIGGQSTYNNGSREVQITGRIFRETIMKFNIRSACFTIRYSPETDLFTITTYGYGHGCGLSQHGSNILATHYGYTYDQILNFYYEGATIA